jgi:TRAP-type C4-dicarboxylate transport system permease small subunit
MGRPGRQGAAVRHVLAGLAILLSSALLSIVGTILMLPFWRWLESTYGVEAVGHSGPAEWCYLVTFLASVLTGTLLYALRFPRAK